MTEMTEIGSIRHFLGMKSTQYQLFNLQGSSDGHSDEDDPRDYKRGGALSVLFPLHM